MEYTEQELTALFDAVMVSASDIERNTPHFRDEIKLSVKLILDGRVGRRASPAPYTLDLPAALLLMRAARAQGLATARDEIRKAGEREQATWDQLVRDVKEARERGAKEMLDKVLALTQRLADRCVDAMRKNAQSPNMVSNAFDEGAYAMATNISCALKELSPSEGPSEYERGAAEMRERSARVADDGLWHGEIAAQIRSLAVTKGETQ